MNGFMFLVYKFIGGLLTPPGCFFALLFGILLWGIFRVKERAAVRINILLLLTLSIMYLLFMPLTAAYLMNILEEPRPDLPEDDVSTMVVVLAGGGTHPVLGKGNEIELAEQSYQRLGEGVLLASKKGWSAVYSGAYEEGDADIYKNSLAEAVKTWGMQGELIIESSSRNTWENLKEIMKIAEKKGIKRIILSTTAYHMKRSLWMAQKIMPSMEIIPWPSGWKSTQNSIALNSFAPSPRAFWDSCTAIREIIGLLAYKVFT